MFITGSGAGAAVRRRLGAQVRAGGERRHAGGREAAPRRRLSVIELGGQDAKIIIFKEDEKTGDKTAVAVDERQVRVGHRRHHRQVHAQGRHAAAEVVRQLALRRLEAAPRRRQVRRVRRDRHRQPGQERHPVERGPVLAGRRDRACRTCRCSRAATRCKPQGAAARRAEHLPAVPAGLLAPAHPRDLGRARLRLPEGRADRGADLRPGERAVLRRVRRGAVRPARGGRRRRATRASTALARVHHQRPQGAPRRDARARRSSKDERRARRRSASSTRSRSSSRRRSSRARSCAASSASTAARPRPRRCSSTRTTNILARPTSSRRATRSRTRRSSSRSSQDYVDRARARRSRSSASAPPATPPTCSRSRVQSRREHRRDRRAHDERRALLRRRRRHLRHRRAGHQGPVHEERRHQELPPVEPVLGRQRHAAAGDGRSVRRAGHRVRRHRLRGRARAQVQLRLRRVPRHRPRELPEGGLLEGGAARRPRAGAAEERLAVRGADPAPGRARHASSCSRAARSTTSPRSRRRSTTSRSACPGAEVFVHPHTGEAGAIGAAIETLRVVKRRGKSTLHRPRRGDRPRVHDEERRGDASATSARTTASARSSTPRRPTARPAATSPASPARRARSRAKEAMLALVAERKKTDEAVPEPRRLRGEAARSATSTTPAPLPDDGHADRGRRGRRRASSACGACEITRPFQRSSAGGAGEAPAHRASASRACSTSTRRRRSSARTSRRSASRSRTSSSRDETTEEMWVEGGKYGSIDPCFPSKVAQAHIHNLLFHHHTRREAAPLHLLPDASPTCRRSCNNTMDNASLPDRRRRARRA